MARTADIWDIWDKLSGKGGYMREVTVEQALNREAELLGGRALKWVSPGNAGIPDRIVVLPMERCPCCGTQARIGAIELKAPGKAPRKLQERQAEGLRALGMPVGWTDLPAGARTWVQGLARGLQ